MATHGASRRFKSYQGDQLEAAAKQIATWDWSKVDEVCTVQPAECYLEIAWCPEGASRRGIKL
jgi:hypothetical protein